MMLFKDILHNNDAKKHLVQRSNDARVSHAQLFSGNKNAPKLALALAYAQYLNCEDSLGDDSCNKCKSCLKFNKLAHPDLHVVFPISKNKKTGQVSSNDFLEDWRGAIKKNKELTLDDWSNIMVHANKNSQLLKIHKSESDLIKNKLRFKNYEAKYRIVLIWIAELMNLEASNKLLKIIEEPPPGTVFLLITEDKTRILETIRSRTQEVVCVVSEKNRNIIPKEKEASTNEKKATNIEAEETHLNEDRNNRFLDLFIHWMRGVYKKDVLSIINLMDELTKLNKSQQKLFYTYTISIIRDCLILNFKAPELLSMNEKENKFVNNFSQFIDIKSGKKIAMLLEETVNAISRNANTKILFLDLSLQLFPLLKKIKV